VADPVPFGIPSPEAYAKASREAELGKYVAPDNVFGRMAVGGAYDLARMSGYRSPEEHKAAVANRLFQEAQAEVTSDDPTQARLQLLSGAARKFNQAGFTDYVQMIGPELIGLQKQALEQRKLLSEASRNETETGKTILDAQKLQLMLPSDLQKNQIEAAQAGLNYSQGTNEGQNWVSPTGQTRNVLKNDAATIAGLRAAGWTTYNAAVQSSTPGDLTKKTQGELEAASIGNATTIDTIRHAFSQYDPSFLTFLGQGKAKFSEIKEKAGLNLSPSEKANFDRYSAFVGDTVGALNDYILNQTGKQMSIKEAERLAKAFPTSDDSPTQFVSKSRNVVRKIIAFQKRATAYAANGILNVPEGAIDVDNIRVSDDEIKAVLGNKFSAPGTTNASTKWQTLPNGLRIRLQQ
jgi:hypothetical protein